MLLRYSRKEYQTVHQAREVLLILFLLLLLHYDKLLLAPLLSEYVSIRQHTSTFVSAYVFYVSAYVGISVRILLHYQCMRP
jgi:hypothetical protein